jgi:hypothetical protein
MTTNRIPDTYDPEALPFRVVPEGKHPTMGLTLGELDGINTKLKANVMTEIDDGPKAAQALALVAQAWARRIDPSAKLEPFMRLELGEIRECLGDTDDNGEDDNGEDPTGHTPE